MVAYPEFSKLLNAHLSQQDRPASWLARELKVHRGTVARWLNDYTRPADLDTVVRIASLLDLTEVECYQLIRSAGYDVKLAEKTIQHQSIKSAGYDVKLAEKTIQPKTTTIELKIEGDFNSYSPEDQEAFLKAIESLLHLHADIKITNVRHG